MNSESIRTLTQYREDTKWQDDPFDRLFVPEDQNLKVLENGRLETYIGDTVIFELDNDVKRVLKAMRNALHEQFASILCIPLPEDSFHITLHSLCDGPVGELHHLMHMMTAHEPRVNALLEQFRLEYPGPIRVRPTRIVSMVGRSIVLLFEPADEAACAALMDMYHRLQCIVPLSHPLTLHVTLAYYRPRFHYNGNPAPDLYRAFGDVLRSHPLDETELDMRLLHYRCFRDMSRYTSREEFFARISFDGQLSLARSLIEEAGGKLNRSILRRMAGEGLELSTKQIDKICREAYYGMFDPLIADLNDPQARVVSCSSGFDGPGARQWLAAAIVLNLYHRGMLNETAEEFGKENLIRRFLHDLRW